MGVLQGEQNPKEAQLKANQARSMSCPACETLCLFWSPRNLQSTGVKTRSILLFLPRQRQSSSC